jgi:hypothetical protein
MLPAQPQPIPQKPCPECHLMTPGWRKHCIHCGKPLAAAAAQTNRLSQQHPGEALAAN